jgi:hypothetical protein
MATAKKTAPPLPPTIRDILAERQTTHGDFTDHANCAQELKNVFRSHCMVPPTNVQAEAVEMILHKLARIASGNPNYKDHWDDIAGYATLAADRVSES